MQSRNPLDHMLIGILYGIFLSMFLITYAGVLYIFKGAEPFNKVDIGIINLCILYLLGGMAGGAIGGYFYRHATTWLGAALVGVVALLPVSIGASFLVPGWTTLSEVLFDAIIYAVIVGTPLGIILLKPSWDDPVH